MAFWTYILRCVDSSYYTGHTDNLEKRIAEHHSGAITSCYTYTRRPLELVFTQDFKTREEALASEQQIKGWSRKKKEALMRGDWAEISRLAKSATPVRPEPFDSVRPEPVEGHESPLPVRPEPVEGHKSPLPVRPEPVEGHKSPLPVRPELVEGHESTLPVHPEPVEGENSTRLRQAQPERSGGDDE
ncbi:MAG: GIY-YIG nuclease family protein [Pseudomonadota bacterium]